MSFASVLRGASLLAVGACIVFASLAQPAKPEEPAVSALLARYAALQKDLEHNAFGRPLHLDSRQAGNELSGDVYAVQEHPYARLNAALDSADNWCDILILHFNVKRCTHSEGAAPGKLTLYIGTKRAAQADSGQRVEFDFHVRKDTADYLRVELHADKGPLGTSNFNIVLEAAPLPADRSFIHLYYAYSYGTLARLATQAYLGTIGSDKVGFSVVGHAADGRPVYVDDVRGIIERNTMRYYLAIDTYIATLGATSNAQLDDRLRRWFAATEQYARQLHEISESDYLKMKRAEIEPARHPAPAGGD